jgi:hypothetical protein
VQGPRLPCRRRDADVTAMLGAAAWLALFLLAFVAIALGRLRDGRCGRCGVPAVAVMRRGVTQPATQLAIAASLAGRHSAGVLNTPDAVR